MRAFLAGVDPGCPLTAAAVRFSADGRLEALHVIDGEGVATQEARGKGRRWINSPDALARWLAVLRDAAREEGEAMEGVVEAAATRPGQGAASQARYIASAGIASGVLAGLGVRARVVQPAVWKGAMKLTQDKERSRRMAQEEAGALGAGLFDRKKDHDRAEAFLLTLWLRRRLMEERGAA